MAFLPDRKEERHRGKRMEPVDIDVDRVKPRFNRDRFMLEQAKVMESYGTSLARKSGPSDAPERGKKMFGDRCKCDMEIFRKFGTFPPPPPPVQRLNDFSDDFLEGLVHKGHDQERLQGERAMAETESAFERNLKKGTVDKFYRTPIHPFAENYNPKVDSHGLLGSLQSKSDDGRHGGKKIDPTPKKYDPQPIEGFPGLGVGGSPMKFDQIKSRPLERITPGANSLPQPPRKLSPLREAQGLTTPTAAPAAPPSFPRMRQEHAQPPAFGNPSLDKGCRLTDQRFDPLHLKAQTGSPGDPRNHAQRLGRVDRPPSVGSKVIHGYVDGVPEPRQRTVKMFPDITVNETEGAVPGFRGFGRADKEIEKPRGRAHIQPYRSHTSMF